MATGGNGMNDFFDVMGQVSNGLTCVQYSRMLTTSELPVLCVYVYIMCMLVYVCCMCVHAHVCVHLCIRVHACMCVHPRICCM